MVKVEGKETIMKKDDIIEEKFMIKVEKAAEAHLVVAALIATVTFAAGIAVPGGFVDGKDTDAGAAILRTNVAFKAFIISNSIAMVLSTISALIQLFVPMWFHQYFTFSGGTLFFVAFSLTVFAMGAMMLAFFMGIFCVLGIHSSFHLPKYYSDGGDIPYSLLIPSLITFFCFCLPLLMIPGFANSLRMHLSVFYLMAKHSWSIRGDKKWCPRVLNKYYNILKTKKIKDRSRFLISKTN